MLRESELPNIYVERVDLISQCIYRVWARSRKRSGIGESQVRGARDGVLATRSTARCTTTSLCC